MRWTSDDMMDTEGILGQELYIPDYPAEIEVMGFFNDPLLSAEIDSMLNEAELMGIDLDDPELMGAWLKNLINKIKARRKAKKEAGQEPAQMPTINVNTGQGTATIGPQGVQWTDPATGAPSTAAAAAPGGIAEMLKNPWVIGGGAAALLLLIMMMKRRG